MPIERDRGSLVGMGESSLALDLHSIVAAGEWPAMELNAATIADIQQLLMILEQLYAPESGWPEDLPKTPEAIAPYVAEEVDRVLDRDWSSRSATPPSVGPCQDADSRSSVAPTYLTLEAWLSQLLWQVVCSDWTVMALLEGVAAWRSQPDPSGRDDAGLIRLIPCLDVTAGETHQRLDLTTYRAPAPWLPADTVVRLADTRPWTNDGITVDALLNQITDWLSMVPMLRSLLATQPMQWLEPGQSWQSVTVSLKLGLEFRPYPIDELMGGDRTGWPNLQVHFTQSDWRSQMQSRLAQMQQRRAIEERGTQWQAIAPTGNVLELVRQADELVSHVSHPRWQTHCTVLNDAIALHDLNHWLIWHLSRSDDRVMRLLGGLSMRSLQPGQGWQSGMLRLVAALHIDTPNRPLAIDLATGQRLTADAMDSRTILQALGDWTSPAIAAADWLASLQQAICDRTPVLQLQEPTAIELRDARGDRLGSGMLHLRLFLEWVV